MGSTASSPPDVPAARYRNFWEKTAPVAVKIKLKRLGKIRAPYYRIVVADSRTKRDGRAIEEIGKYHPKAEPSFIEVNSDRAQHWLSVGAQPTDPVRKIFEITGDWQKFKGLPGTEGTLQTAAAKEDRKEVFAAAVRETLGESAGATKGRGRSAAAAKDRAEKPARKAKAGTEAAAADVNADADAAGSG
jgi:small subunit ribosomal protein S16